jgi:GNAT superfamily N-acetyltransferase
VSSRSDFEILDVTDETSFGLLPACADPRFDHRSCDYWENDVRGAKTARPAWWQPTPNRPAPRPRAVSDNPFAPAAPEADGFNPFTAPSSDAGTSGLGPDEPFGTPNFNPFASDPALDADAISWDAPTKLRLLTRGREVFGSFAKVLLLDSEPAAFAQFGPLSAYPRAQQIRELYPRLPQSPLPAVITCIATTAAHRGQGLGYALVEAITADLAGRGFAAVEAYPDLALGRDEAAAAGPGFWGRCGFELAAEDERYPVMRRVLD